MPIGQWSFKSYLQASQENLDVPDNWTWIFLRPANLDVKKKPSASIPPTKILLVLNGWKGCNCLITKHKKKHESSLFCKTRNHNFKCKIRAFWAPNLLGTLVGILPLHTSWPEISHITLCATYIHAVTQWSEDVGFTVNSGLIMFGTFKWSNI